MRMRSVCPRTPPVSPHESTITFMKVDCQWHPDFVLWEETVTCCFKTLVCDWKSILQFAFFCCFFLAINQFVCFCSIKPEAPLYLVAAKEQLVHNVMNRCLCGVVSDGERKVHTRYVVNSLHWTERCIIFLFDKMSSLLDCSNNEHGTSAR